MVVTIDPPAPGRSLGREGSGAGFRPFVARLAGACGLVGWVKNTPVGVAIHLEGPSERLE